MGLGPRCATGQCVTGRPMGFVANRRALKAPRAGAGPTATGTPAPRSWPYLASCTSSCRHISCSEKISGCSTLQWSRSSSHTVTSSGRQAKSATNCRVAAA
eukprot:CAMPEP_0175304014 /NCGR_PEP_ID=MMETSP0093-20121207/63010_1 /TAXON_ID=311494 /ORGANISM="Alexandrium monilatum, Strain CCMP3105" /LENGTH=100 /DNA_ID=CAMNT_0016600397 /DNA_START=12 /DNA_END=314 /DNA_ORIENTATION=+